MEMYMKCPNFEICSVNNCPLSVEYIANAEDKEQACRLTKEETKRIVRQVERDSEEEKQKTVISHKLLSTALQTRVNRLVKKECCNYDKGNCSIRDNGTYVKCPQVGSKTIICDWFITSVLPIDSKLETDIVNTKEATGEAIEASEKKARNVYTKEQQDKVRRADGSLYKMTKEQADKAHKLIHNCYYERGGNCAILSKNGYVCKCPQLVSNTICCVWFADAVITLNKDLCEEVFVDEVKPVMVELVKEEPIEVEPIKQVETIKEKVVKMKRCNICGNLFVPKSNRSKYCKECAQKEQVKKSAGRQRKFRAKN